MIRGLASGLLLLFAALSHAADCQKTETVCIDAAPCKTMYGISVCLAGVTPPAGGINVTSLCWQYTDTYNCLKPESIDYCAALVNAGCGQTGTTPSQTAFNGTTMVNTNTFRCGTDFGTPTNTIRLADSYTITKDATDTSQCTSLSGNANCMKAASVCTEGPFTKVINGLAVTKDCWNWQETYTCASVNMSSDCQSLVDKGCTITSEKCITNLANGSCATKEKIYSCPDKPASSSTDKDCSAQAFCMDGQCFDSGHAPDADIFKVATAMEAAREAGLYMDPNSLEMFKGYSSNCAKGYGGLKNCCKTSGGGSVMNNSSVMGAAMGATIKSASDYAGQTMRYGSTYVYDALFESDSGGMITQGLGAMLDLDGPATALTPTASFGMYGLTWTAGAVPTSVMGVNTISLASQTGIQGLYFSPVGLYIAVAMIIIQELISCEPEDQILGMKRGQNLCHFAGSYCSVKEPILGTCLETTEAYCCFNSRLARIINEQGRPQIGKSWGSGESPDCSGFTPEQLQGLDFSQMDLREFYAEIMANMKTPDVSQAAQKAQSTVTNKVNYYYGQ